MKNKFLFLPAACLLLSSCGGYVSHYKALMLATTKTINTGTINFKKFSGRYVFTLKKVNTSEGTINYKASLESGAISVYYVDIFNNKSLMFGIKSNQSFEGSAGYVEKGQKIKIIIETSEVSNNGYFHFDLD